MLKCDFETWREVQDAEVEYFTTEVDYLKKVENPQNYFKNWEEVKECIDNYSELILVEEDFVYDEKTWLEEIYARVKPLFVSLLEHLSRNEENYFSEYINGVW